MAHFELVDPTLLSGAREIVTTLRQNGFAACLAGGAVRDLVLGKSVSDIDVATSARPEQVEALFEKTIPIGKEFGVVIVVIDSVNYEVTTFRRDLSYLDGRHPSGVGFTSPEEDAARRDFTVNALFMDPFNGEIQDFVGGQADLERRLIRTVGNPEDRFEEDKLRVLRAARLACQLDFEIVPETEAAIRKFASQVTMVSRERIRDELLRIITGPRPARGLRLLLEFGLLAEVLPEAAAMSGVQQPPEFHPEGDVFTHTCLMFELSGGGLSETLALGILLHDVGKPPTFTVRERIRFDGHAELGARMADEICRRLRLANESIERVVELVKDHLRFMHVPEMRESTLKRFLRQKNFDEHLELHRLDCLGSHGDLSNYEFCLRKLAEFGRESIRPAPLLNGHDLIAMGLRPGPVFSEILRAVEDQQLEGRLADKAEALEFVRRGWIDASE